MNIKHVGMTAQGNLTKLTIIVDGDRSTIGDMVMQANEDPDAKPYELKIEKVKNKRSLDANGYAWVLIDKLAQKLRTDKTDVYRNAIKDIGGVSTMVCIKQDAAETMKREWEKRGVGWQVEEMPSKLKGCVNLILYYGSSVYDTKQMSALIDRLIEECKEQGIETLTPLELQRLKGYSAL